MALYFVPALHTRDSNPLEGCIDGHLTRVYIVDACRDNNTLYSCSNIKIDSGFGSDIRVISSGYYIILAEFGFLLTILQHCSDNLHVQYAC